MALSGRRGDPMVITLFALFFVLIFLGVPIAFSLAAASALSLMLFTDTPMLLVWCSGCIRGWMSLP
ncbi:hypothetical protein [Salinicola tamaricis]|uniref:hypothetical protein n=1 Tax=Salinicola tamaricis TaxID=1771309 RepID=UPI0013EAF79B|nr:hypothetical protein [Salinicola tamaricis]